VRLGLHKDAKADLISKVPLFAGLSKKQLSQVAQIADEIDLPKGRVLIREGDRGREFFVLLEGEVEILQGGERIRTMRDGDFFGEVALISDVPRVATVTALTPLRVLVIRDREFEALVEDTPQIALKVLQAVAERLPSDDH
jgi:CRP-like cAMP-binding protein